MLTIFSTPKPFCGHIGTIQMNAFRSWSVLQSKCEVIILSNGYGTTKIATELNLKHIPDIVRNEYGTPLLNSLFEAAETRAKYDLLCYVNSDIILTGNLLVAINRNGFARVRCKECSEEFLLAPLDIVFLMTF